VRGQRAGPEGQVPEEVLRVRRLLPLDQLEDVPHQHCVAREWRWGCAPSCLPPALPSCAHHEWCWYLYPVTWWVGCMASCRAPWSPLKLTCTSTACMGTPLLVGWYAHTMCSHAKVYPCRTVRQHYGAMKACTLTIVSATFDTMHAKPYHISMVSKCRLLVPLPPGPPEQKPCIAHNSPSLSEMGAAGRCALINASVHRHQPPCCPVHDVGIPLQVRYGLVQC
jgi:hypothetical protein